MEYIWRNHKRYYIILVNMANKHKTTSKKTKTATHNFEPTKVALATTCLGVSVVVLLAVIAVTTL